MLKFKHQVILGGVYNLKKDTVDHALSIVSSVFLFVISLITFNNVNLKDVYSIFIYVVPLTFSFGVPNIIMWRSLCGGKNQKESFVIPLKIALSIMFILISFIILVFIFAFGTVLEVRLIDSSLHFGWTTSGNLAFFGSEFHSLLPSIWLCLFCPALNLFNCFTNILLLLSDISKRKNKK